MSSFLRRQEPSDFWLTMTAVMNAQRRWAPAFAGATSVRMTLRRL